MNLSSSLSTIINELKEIFQSHKVCPSHGIEHAIKVMNHANEALQEEYELPDDIKFCVLLAALLHDADDRKFFPTHLNYENARHILRNTIFAQSISKTVELKNLIIQMISLVSCSKNGDNIPVEIQKNPRKEWMLYPRYADRIEALGLVGIKRCYQYTLTAKMPLFCKKTSTDPGTPKVSNEKELWKIATEKRYQEYTTGKLGNSKSMIDHYYDKLLRIGFFPIENNYLKEMGKRGIQPLIDFVLEFSRTGSISEEYFISL